MLAHDHSPDESYGQRILKLGKYQFAAIWYSYFQDLDPDPTLAVRQAAAVQIASGPKH
jgi:hypothetical protein